MARQMAAIAAGAAPADAYEQQEHQHDISVRSLLRMVNSLYGVLARQNADLVAANAQLEARVQERTEALERSNDELQQANEQLRAFRAPMACCASTTAPTLTSACWKRWSVPAASSSRCRR